VATNQRLKVPQSAIGLSHAHDSVAENPRCPRNRSAGPMSGTTEMWRRPETMPGSREVGASGSVPMWATAQTSAPWLN